MVYNIYNMATFSRPSSKKSRSKRPFLLIFAVLAFLFIIFLILINLPKEPLSTPETPAFTPTSDISILREQMYNGSSYAYSQNYSDDYLIGVLNEWITYPESTESQSSLAIFSIYLMSIFGLTDSALAQFNSLILQDPTSSESCELYEYRALLASFLSEPSDSLITIKNSRDSYCKNSPVASTFPEAKSAFLKGNYTPSIFAFESLDYSTLSDEEKLFAYSVLLNHYKLTHDDSEYEKIANNLKPLYTTQKEIH